MSTVQLTVVIPTRNRAELAIAAIGSVLAESLDTVRVLVSDNSTLHGERERLATHCASLGAEAVQYVTPPEPLPMAAHWDWAMHQALASAATTHVAFLTDRMLFLPGRLPEMLAVLEASPREVVTYYHDRIDDFSSTVSLEQYPWSGQVLAVSSDELLRRASRVSLYCPAFPKMLNTAAPRALLEAIRARFGNYFDSVSPDYNFCFRSLAISDRVVFYDCSVLIQYALDRSNGASYERGLPSRDSVDFLQTIGSEPTFDVPIPRIPTVGNAILHEYETVRRQVGGERFPPIAFTPYVRYLARELHRMRNVPLREESFRLLQREAHRAGVRVRAPLYRWLPPGVRLGPARLVEHALWKLVSTARMRAHRRSDCEGGGRTRAAGFRSTAEALEFAKRHPRWRSPTRAHLAECGKMSALAGGPA